MRDKSREGENLQKDFDREKESSIAKITETSEGLIKMALRIITFFDRRREISLEDEYRDDPEGYKLEKEHEELLGRHYICWMLAIQQSHPEVLDEAWNLYGGKEQKETSDEQFTGNVLAGVKKALPVFDEYDPEYAAKKKRRIAKNEWLYEELASLFFPSDPM